MQTILFSSNSPSALNEVKRKGRFNPWSLEDLMKRKETFKDGPFDSISLPLARRGFVFNGVKKTIECILCKEEFSEINKNVDNEEVLDILFKNKHHRSCPWKKRRCVENVTTTAIYEATITNKSNDEKNITDYSSTLDEVTIPIKRIKRQFDRAIGI